MIDIQHLPQGVLSEIAQRHPDANYTQYGIVDYETRSCRLDYREYEPLTQPVEVLDCETFEPMTVDGTTHHYAAVFSMRSNGNSIRAVLKSAPIIARKSAQDA